MGNGCSGGSNTAHSHAPAGTTHTIYVTTGDKKGASTDGNIYFRARDEQGAESAEQLIDATWKDDFETGRTDTFHLDLGDLGRVVEIQIRRDETSADDDWFLQRVDVASIAPKPKSIFPVNRWIHANDTLYMSEFDSCLPQQDKHPEQRAKELDKKRGMYKLTQHIPGGPLQVESLPADESFSNDYKWDITAMKLKLGAQAKFVDLTTSKIESLADFKKLYRGDVFPVPYGEKNWRSDEEFGNQRLAGCNPISLNLCTAIPEHMAVTADMLEPSLELKSLQECLDKKKIYMVDLRYMSDIECTAGRKLCGPTALFYVKNNGELVPIAIQLMPAPAENNPVFLPSDPEYTWLAAKMWFNLSDSSHHQSVIHLGFTHLVMETVSVCTHRQLSPSHPMFRLLAPHFIYLLAINTLAVNKLVSEGGWVDKDMHIGRTGMFNIIKHNWKYWNVKEHGNLLKDLSMRGVDDSNALPNYPYRDDALLLWDAISKYVFTIVDQVYDTLDKLKDDKEIQAWAKELADADVTGMPSSFSSQTELSETITTFIFISSVGHAAANFCQYDEYAFQPNYPPMLYGEPPKDKRALTEDDIVNCLSPKEQILSAMIVTKLLSEKGTNELTNFEMPYSFDPTAVKALEQFSADLVDISVTIDARNDKRTRKYPYLNPKSVPNAISI